MKDLSHPDYQIAPGIVNLTKWSLENEPKGEPRFKVGDRVMLTIPLYVYRVGQDCDGTPLFAASLEDPTKLEPSELAHDWTLKVNCLSADSFRPATEAEIKAYETW